MIQSDKASGRHSYQGLDAIRLVLADGSTAVISTFGAHVLSWTPTGSGERLYLSPTADLTSGAAIRGGVPIIFPQFSDRGPFPRHGFARTATWTLEEIQEDPQAGYDGTARATFRLRADALTRAVWPHEFTARLVVTLTKGRLTIELQVQNTDTQAFDFTGALHTYLRVGEIETVSLTGLHGCQRLLPGSANPDTETRRELTLNGEIDNIYLAPPRPLLLTDGHHALAIEAEGFPDIVVWNPWRAKCAALKDMPNDDFRHMLCIEPAIVGEPVRLEPGQSWQGRQILTTLDTD